MAVKPSRWKSGPVDAVPLLSLIGLMAAFNATYTIRVLTMGPTRLVAGCVQSGILLLMMGLYGWTASKSGVEGRGSSRSVLVLATVLLALNLLSNHLARFVAVVYRPPPLGAALAVAAGWTGFLVLARRRGLTQRLALVAFMAAVVTTRAIGLGLVPFHRLSGDMLSVIDRGLSELFQGRFPYRNYPPPMPYFPLTFLTYAPMKALGLDLRWANVVCDALTVGVAAGARRFGAQPLSWRQFALPLLMLNPTWTFLSLETHYAPSVLAAALLGRALAVGSARSQALALGLAVGANQSFVLMGPVLAANWARQEGWVRAVKWAAIAAGETVLVVMPWLVWNAGEFVRTSLLFRSPLPPEVLEGRISLLPALRLLGLSGMSPYLLVGSVCLASVGVHAGKKSGRVATFVALGYSGALMFLGPIIFPHYFLPPMALLASGTRFRLASHGEGEAAAEPASPGCAARRQPRPPCPERDS